MRRGLSKGMDLQFQNILLPQKGGLFQPLRRSLDFHLPHLPSLV